MIKKYSVITDHRPDTDPHTDHHKSFYLSTKETEIWRRTIHLFYPGLEWPCSAKICHVSSFFVQASPQIFS